MARLDRYRQNPEISMRMSSAPGQELLDCAELIVFQQQIGLGASPIVLALNKRRGQPSFPFDRNSCFGK